MLEDVFRVSGFLVANLAFAACHDSIAGAPEASPPPAHISAYTWSSLTFAKASGCAAHWGDEVPARIAFDESRTSRVGVPLGGRVVQVLVERGQHVAANAPLFTIASADLAELRSQRERSQLEVATARSTLDRVRALVDAKALPAKELVVAEQGLIEAELTARTSAQKLAALHVTQVDDVSFTITAPRAGVVVEVKVTPGQQVSADTGPLLAIADVTDVWVYADLVDEGRIAIGTPARVTLDGEPTLEGAVDQVSAIVDPDRHTVPVRVRLENASGSLRPGGYAQVRFFDAATSDLCVPSTAVLSDGARHYVYVRTDHATRRREVTVAHADAGSTAIRRGLVRGDEVVATGTGVLENQLSQD